MDQEWTYRPPLLIGEKIEWHGGETAIGSQDFVPQGTYVGSVAWIGRISDISSDWIAGINFEKKILGGGNGAWKSRRMFACPDGFGLFLPITSVSKLSNDGGSLKSNNFKATAGSKINKYQTKDTSKASKSSSQIAVKEGEISPETSTEHPNASCLAAMNGPNMDSEEREILKQNIKASYKKSNSLQHFPCRTNPGPPLSHGHILDDGCRSKPDKGGILNIFKWFSKKSSKHSRSLSTFSSISSNSHLSNEEIPKCKETSPVLFSPLRHSKSADNPKSMKRECESVLDRGDISQSEGSHIGSDLKISNRRRSTASLQSTGSQVSILSFSHRPKKRPAPQPPKSASLSQADSSLSGPHIRGSESANSCNLLITAKPSDEDGRIYSRAKRKAPQPPSNCDSGISIDKESSSTLSSSRTSCPQSSTLSSMDSIGKSDISTLKSTSNSDSDDFITRSDSSLNKLSKFPLLHEKEPISPKPWYKRKKLKNVKEKLSKSKKRNVDPPWMPEIQYVRQNLELNPSIPNVVEKGYENRFSLLSNISELDNAAAELIKREKELKSMKHLDSSPRLLRQGDIAPVEASSKDESKNVTFIQDPSQLDSYDNLKCSEGHLHSISSDLKLTPEVNALRERGISSSSNENVAFDNKHSASSNNQHLSNKFVSSNEEHTKETPKQKAIFDSEVFYQLAKDAKVNSDSKRKKFPSQDNGKKSQAKKEENNKLFEQDFLAHLRRPIKNFGIRMNNAFTPDVSTIIEGSESIASSSATPAEDVESDFLTTALGNADRGQEILSIASELNNDYQLNTLDLQDIMRGFVADIGQDSSNKTQVDIMKNECKNVRAEQIRNEVMISREQDNFLAWQNAMKNATESASSVDDDPIKVLEGKKQWVCSSCTLINQPWRLHCEACSTLRPPNPKRINQDSDNDSSHYSYSNASPITVINENQRIDVPVTTPGWENELEKYFSDFDTHADNLKHLHSMASRSNSDSKVTSEIKIGAKPKIRSNLPNSMDLDEIRRARINKFDQDSEFENNIPDITNSHSNIEYMQESSPNLKKSKKLQKELIPFKTNIVNEMKSRFTENKKSNNHYKKQITNVSGAVKSAVSIFNQMDQFKLAIKPQEPRRRISLSSVPSIEFSDDNTSVVSRPEVRSPIQLDVDITSAINKFDEMAALAEVERLPSLKTKVLPKREGHAFMPIKPRTLENGIPCDNLPKHQVEMTSPPQSRSFCFPNRNAQNIESISIHSSNSSNSEAKIYNENHEDAIILSASENELKEKIGKAQEKTEAKSMLKNETKESLAYSLSNDQILNHEVESNYYEPISINNNPVSVVVNKVEEIRDPYMKDGVLYPMSENQRRRSLSIGSATFELIQAKDFASISAQHSLRSSPTEESIGFESAISFEDFQVPEQQEERMPDILRLENLVVEDSLHLNKEDQKKELERLSKELTEIDGIENFKSSLKSEAADTSHKEITMRRIFKALEVAIAKGHNKEAARLASDLANLKLSSVAEKLDNLNSNKEDLQSSPLIVTPEISPKSHSDLNNLQISMPGTSLTSKDLSNPMSEGSLGASALMNGIHVDEESNEVKEPSVAIRQTKVDPLRREVKSDAVRPFAEASSQDNALSEFSVQMYVEDKANHQGPTPVNVKLTMTVGELKQKVAEEFGFPLEVQRWILGKKLADDDNRTLGYHKVTSEHCPIFLYLVAPERETGSLVKRKKKKKIIVDFKKSLLQAKETKSKESQQQESDLKLNPSPSMVESHSVAQQNINSIELGEDQINQAFEDLYQQDKLSVTEEMMNDAFNQSPILRTKSYSTSKDKAKRSPSQKKKGGHLVEGSPSSPKHTNSIVHKSSNEGKKSKSSTKETVEAPSTFKASHKFSDETNVETADGDWSCPRCTLVNPRERPGCAACATDRPDVKWNFNAALKALDKQGCVPNLDSFECVVCFLEIQPKEGVVLRECLHSFCRKCLKDAVKYSETAQVKCPYMDNTYSCQFFLQERELKDLVTPDEYTKHHEKSIKQAASAMTNVFYCKTPDCKGFCQYEDNVNEFLCDVCLKKNCLTCQAQHENQTCKQYQDDVLHKQDESALKTKKFFDDMIRRGNGMPCPQCSVMLVRKWGCDWMRCPMCRTEICWVTRGPRWGPKGQGDTSGGCKCGINGRKCHPKCTYCH